MRARRGFIFTADAIFAFYLITIMLSVLMLLSLVPKVYIEQSQALAKDTLIVMVNTKLIDLSGDSRYPYINSLLYIQNNSQAAWPMFLRTPEHNYSVDSFYPNSSSLWWSTGQGLGAGIPIAVYSSPTIYNGKIVIATRNGTYLIDENKGVRFTSWYVPIRSDSTPAVDNGRVFIGSLDNQTFAIDDSGNIVWNRTVGGPVYSSPEVHSGKVFFTAMDGLLYSIDEVSGSLNGFFTASANISSSPAVYNGRVYVLSNDGVLYAVSESSNKLLWKYNTTSPLPSSIITLNPTPSPMAAGDVVYFSDNSVLYAVNSTNGTQLWTASLGGGAYYTSSPVIYGNTVYVGYSDGIVEINATSGNLVVHPTSSRVVSTPVVSRDALIVVNEAGGVGSAGSLVVFNNPWNSTTPKWSVMFANSTHSSPALVNGRIYVITYGGNLSAFGNCSMWDQNMDVADSIAAFWLVQKKDCSGAMAKEFLDSAIPQGQGYELVIKSAGIVGLQCDNTSKVGVESIYTNDCNQTRYQRILIEDDRFISGVAQKGSTVYYAQNPLDLELRVWN